MHHWILRGFFLSFLISTAGAHAQDGPTPNSAPTLPGKITTEVLQSKVPGSQPEREERLEVETEHVRYTLTTRGGTLSHAILKEDRYTIEAQSGLEGVPEDKVKGGQIDMITTWGTKWLPFQSVFGDLNYPGVATLKVRAAASGEVEGAIDGGVLLAPQNRDGLAVDRPIQRGDVLKITAPASIAGEYAVASVGTHGTITPEKPFAEPVVQGVRYQVLRKGSVGTLYESTPYFTRVSEGAVLPATYVWPDPKHDESPIWVERTFAPGAHPYELKLTVTVHNLGADGQLLQVQNGLRIGAWQHPNTEGPGMFTRISPMLNATCLADSSVERSTFQALHEEALEQFQREGRARTTKSYPRGAQWIAADNTYFIQAAAPTPFTEGGGQCRLGFDDFNPAVSGAWVLWAQYLAPNRVELIKKPNGCLPVWWQGEGGGERCEAAFKALNLPGTASNDEIKRAWEAQRGKASNVAELDRAYEQLSARTQATWRFNLYNGPKDTAFLETSHPRLAKSVEFGWMSFFGEPMHALLLWFYKILGSWPFAIIVMTVSLKLLTWPLSQKGYKSMQKMKDLKPQLDELKAKYGADRNRFAQEQMALMKREGANPVGGCLPLFLQLPIWVGLYGAILGSVELYHEPLGLWISDLSAPDPLFILPVLVGIIQMGQMWFTPQAMGGDELQMKIMKYGMPIMYTVFMLYLPSALVLYIVVNSILTIIQNIYIRRQIGSTT